ncbi:MAG TPA: hypothetical protein VK186_13600 [Candidatus Deferrimicrobium sp.]|nr:hypothetical protein [Candidatus Deferrimicrobium sp.]
MKELITMICLFFVLGGSNHSRHLGRKMKTEDNNKSHPAVKAPDIQP